MRRMSPKMADDGAKRRALSALRELFFVMLSLQYCLLLEMIRKALLLLQSLLKNETKRSSLQLLKLEHLFDGYPILTHTRLTGLHRSSYRTCKACN